MDALIIKWLLIGFCLGAAWVIVYCLLCAGGDANRDGEKTMKKWRR